MKQLMSRPVGAAITMAALLAVVGFPLALFSGMDIYGALLANGVLAAVVIPWTWRATTRYQASPTLEARAAERERAVYAIHRNRAALGVLFAVCVLAILIRLALPH